MLPKIHILATGGTISAKATTTTAMTGYTASEVGVQELIHAVPAIAEVAVISGEQVTNVLSHCLTHETWLKLALRVNVLLESEIDGIVITHGTNTMEETAYFLNLVVKSNKPVILTGAMRPASAISADGPINLLNAVRLAASPEACGHGVLVMLNEKINASREVMKTNTMAVETFQAPELGYLGYMQEGKSYFFRRSLQRHTQDSEFSLDFVHELPRVDIIYGYLGDDGVFVDAAVRSGAKGIVMAATGHGMISDAVKYSLADAQKKGVVIVRATRCPYGMVTEGADEKNHSFIAVGTLSPQKARILLMLGLTKTDNPQELARMFRQY